VPVDRRTRRLLAAALTTGAALTTLLAGGTARAELRYRVVLLKPPVTDDVTSDALARVRGELTAAGFEISTSAQEPSLDVRRALETVGRELDPIAAFAIVRAPSGDTAEIWVCDRMAGKSVIQSVRLDAPGAPPEPPPSAVLAVQAVELLKASLAQYWLASERRSAALPAPPDGGAAPPPAPPAHVTAGLGLAAAVGVLDNVGAVGPIWQPILRASYGGEGGWAGRLTVAGLGGDAALRGPEGSAQIRQTFGVAEILRGFRAGGRVQPVAALGAGVYRARVVGSGAGAYEGVATDSWSALVVAGAGAVIPIGSRVAFVADAQVGLAWPENLIRFDYVEVGRVGRPWLLASAGVLARF
jgi:hypothetical protein